MHIIGTFCHIEYTEYSLHTSTLGNNLNTIYINKQQHYARKIKKKLEKFCKQIQTR